MTLHTWQSSAQDARFFQMTGPVPVTIIAVTADGHVTWTNELTNATFTVQTATALGAETNWMDWVQVPVTNEVTTYRLFDPHPPMDMALIPAGSFTMGNCMNAGPYEGETDELPLHTVYVSAFYMDQYEVTKALWDEVKTWNGGNGYSYDYWDSGLGKTNNHPAHSMDWYDCVKWCNARSQKEGLVPCYYTDAGLTNIYKTGRAAVGVKWSANGYRLPTEAEWEKAARGGATGHRFPWGDMDTIQHSRANYKVFQYAGSGTNYYTYDTSPTSGLHPEFATLPQPYTSPTGYFAPSGYGLCDMAGNILEWCWDWHGPYSGASQVNPTGPSSGGSRVLRGGSWYYDAFLCRTADRNSYNAIDRFYDMGFRCARAADQ